VLAAALRSLTLRVRADSGCAVLGVVAVAGWGASGAGAGAVAARDAVFRGALLIRDAEGVEWAVGALAAAQAGRVSAAAFDAIGGVVADALEQALGALAVAVARVEGAQTRNAVLIDRA